MRESVCVYVCICEYALVEKRWQLHLRIYIRTHTIGAVYAIGAAYSGTTVSRGITASGTYSVLGAASVLEGYA